jgi:hypothetical protein
VAAAVAPGLAGPLGIERPPAPQGKFVVGYAGTHGLANALDTLLGRARCCRTSRVAFVLVGGGPRKPRCSGRPRMLGLPTCTFSIPVPKTQVPALLRCFDLAYIGWQRQPLYRFGISPNKLIDYMMAARPSSMRSKPATTRWPKPAAA